MQMNKVRKIVALTAFTLPLLTQAQSGDAMPEERGLSARLEEIVVTAQRRAQSLQDVPITVNAITAESLEGKGISSVTSLSSVVPGLDVPMVGSVASPYLRGIGSNAADPNNEPSVAMYVDGIYIAAPFANMFTFNNIERVEVLKGPQGTLFGRNATGGVIQIVTREPEHEAALETSLGYANYDTFNANVYGTTGLSENLAVDLAIQHREQGSGWGSNINLGTDLYKDREYSARSKMLYTPTDQTKIIAAIDYTENNTNKGDYHLAPGIVGLDGEKHYFGSHNTDTNHRYSVKARAVGGSIRVEQELPFATLVSMTAYRENKGVYSFDADATPIDFVTAILNQKVTSWTQELQLMDATHEKVEWMAGLFYFDNTAKYDPGSLSGLAIGPDPLVLFGTQKTKSWSLYGQSTVEVAPDTRLTGGIRYTNEEQTFDSAVGSMRLPQEENDFEKMTWRLAVDHNLTSDLMVYASYNRGIKSGGFDLLSPGNTGFKPEILDAYEIGFKSELFESTLRINASVFYYDYEDMQVTSIEHNTTFTANAAGARIRGLDVDILAIPLENLTLTAGLAYLNGEYNDFPNPVVYPASPSEPMPVIADAKGNETIRTPEITGNLGVEYRLPTRVGLFTLAGNMSYNDGFYWAPDERYRQKPYTLVNASIGWRSDNDRFGVSLWGQNLTDKSYLMQGVPSAYGDLAVMAAPRTYGITVSTKFY